MQNLETVYIYIFERVKQVPLLELSISMHRISGQPRNETRQVKKEEEEGSS